MTCVIYFLWTHSDSMFAMMDPTKTNHRVPSVWERISGALMGSISGALIGCGLVGAFLNYSQIRSGDLRVSNPELSVQLMRDDEELM